MSRVDDRDRQMALLVSLLEPATFPMSDYLDALATAHGDVAMAAEALLLPRVKSAGKRKSRTTLESWLARKKGTQLVQVEALVETADSPKPPGKGSPLKAKPPVDLLAALRPTSPTKPLRSKTVPQSALLLTSQAVIDAHELPVTLLQSPLSPSFASALYLALMDESDKWERNRWYLAGKWVESPHTTTVYARKGGGYGERDEGEYVAGETETSRSERRQDGAGQGGAQARYFYSGTELGTPQDYPPLLKRAADLIEPVVNAAIRSRVRYALEWRGDWKANVCGANRYDGASSGVGWHADQLTYLGPYTTIASLSLGTPRAFRLRQTDPIDPSFSTNSKPIRTYEFKLGHNSLCLMNSGCQERFKHTPGYEGDERSIPVDEQRAYTSRINITFRFYREDFHPRPGIGPRGPREGTPVCKCGLPALLRADQKAKARSKLGPSPTKARPPSAARMSKEEMHDPNIESNGRDATFDESRVVEDDMVFFWQCQSPGQTGDLKGCGFFRILDMKTEGRGPCIGDV